ncbi:MAG TPA: thiol:disulfide interchange protein DsbA/DsbL [Marinagarivorans sp.]
MRIAALILGLALPLLACAEDKASTTTPAKTFEEGKHYTVISGATKPAKSDVVDVIEVFWYGCGHCYTFEAHIEPWAEKAPDYVNFTQSPAMWKQRRPGVPQDMMWTHAKLYYAAKAIQGLDKLHHAFFEAMHKDRKLLLDDAEIATVVDKAGFDGKNFVGVMNSFAVAGQVKQADDRQRQYKITGTPEIVVADYYHISASKAGGQKEMLEVVDYLVEKLRK